MLRLVEAIGEPPAAEPAGLLAPPDPDRQPEPVPAVGKQADQLGVLLGAAEEVVAGHDPLGRARPAPIALEAGPDERLVGQVVAGEDARDPLEERRLGHRAGRREEAEHRPLDPVGERARRRSRGPSASASHQRPGATSARRRRPASDRPSAISASSASTWSGGASAGRVERRAAIDGRSGGAPRRRPWRSSGRAAASARSRGPGRRRGVRAGPVRAAVRRRAACRGGPRSLGTPAGPVEASAGASRRRRPAAIRAVELAIRDEPAELARPVEPDQDLAEEPIGGGGLAARLEALDRDVDDGVPDVGRGEGPPIEPLGRAEQARSGHDVGVAGPAGQGIERDIGAGPRPGRQDRARWHQLDAPDRLVVTVAEPCGEQPEPGPDAADRGRDERLRAAVDELDHLAVAGDRGLDRCQRAGQRRGLPAPRRPDRRTRQRGERKAAGRLGPDRPGRRPVGHRQAFLVRANRRLAEDEPDAATQGRAAGPAVPARPSDASAPMARVVDGPLTPTTAVALPSSSARRSLPSSNT